MKITFFKATFLGNVFLRLSSSSFTGTFAAIAGARAVMSLDANHITLVVLDSSVSPLDFNTAGCPLSTA